VRGVAAAALYGFEIIRKHDPLSLFDERYLISSCCSSSTTMRKESVCERRKRGKKCVFEKTRHETQKEDTAVMMMMMRRSITQRGISKISKMSKFITKSQNRMVLQNTALRYCSTESLRQEVRFRFRNRRRFFNTHDKNRSQYYEIKSKRYNTEMLLDCNVFVM
jgi:hypothetical protein